MTDSSRVGALALLSSFALSCGGVASCLPAQVSFRPNYIDTQYGGSGNPGWVQAGDMDGDGDLDIVAGGGRALFVYENRGGGQSWLRHGSLDSTQEMGANAGVLVDVDEDGDLDVLCGRYVGQIGWWENPGGALKTTPWRFHRVHPGFTAWYLHDMILVDIDEDGKAAEVVFNMHLNSYWDAPVQIHWMRITKTPGDWKLYTIQPNRPGPNHCHAGFSVGDINADGHVDLSYSNGWYEAPPDPTGTWKWHPIVTNIYGVSNSQTGDVDGNGSLDLVVSAGHHGKGVYWLEPTDLAKGRWTTHTIDPSIVHPEGLQVHDLDGDGDQDVIAAELFFGTNGQPKWTDKKHNLYLYENLGGSPPAWKKINLAPNSYPSHLPYLVDINGDRKLDLIAESTGAPIVSYFENTTPGSAPAVDRLVPNFFVPVQDESVRILGTGFQAVTEVRFGTRSIVSTRPATWFEGYYRVVSGKEIEFFPPHDLPAATYDVSIQSASGTSQSLPFYTYRAAGPRVRSAAVLDAGATQRIVLHGAGSSPMSYLVMSLVKQPFVIPGVVNLAIGGGGGPLFVFGALTHHPGTGLHVFGPYPTASVLQGLDVHFQAAAWDGSNPTLPLDPTDVWTTKYR